MAPEKDDAAAGARDRFFVDGRLAPGQLVALRGAAARKIDVVLRKRTGDPLELTDSTGRSFAASLRLDDGTVRARVGALLDVSREPLIEIVLAQGIPKGQKMDYVVEKATELGIARIVPLQSERVVGDRRETRKVERWRRLALAAAQQSGRQRVPEVDEPVDVDTLIAGFGAFDAVLLPWELAPRAPLRERLPALLGAPATGDDDTAPAAARRLLVIIGPEGGFSDDEVRRAIAAGAHAVSLGKRILRTETAALVIVSAILYERAEL